MILNEEFIPEGMLITAKVPSKLSGVLRRYEQLPADEAKCKGFLSATEDQL